MRDYKGLSTGVLTREPDTVCAVVNILNLDRYTHKVKVEVWDWSSYDFPVLLPVYIGPDPPTQVNKFNIPKKHLAVLYADLQESQTELYEIRIIQYVQGKLLINCFGRSAPPYTSQTGNTVLQNDLVEMKCWI